MLTPLLFVRKHQLQGFFLLPLTSNYKNKCQIPNSKFQICNNISAIYEYHNPTFAAMEKFLKDLFNESILR